MHTCSHQARVTAGIAAHLSQNKQTIMNSTFEDIFEQRNPNHAFLLQRMRDAIGKDEITFDDINATNLRLIRDFLGMDVTANSLATYMSVIKATVNELANDGFITNNSCTKVLRTKKTPSQNCCLTEEELIKFDEYTPRSETERDAKIIFMRGAFSGARGCDCRAMSEDNVIGDTLTYVSKKTKTGVTQPMHHRLAKYIEQQPSKQHSRASINYAIQAICRKLGFTEPVTLSRDGRMVTKPKYAWITMHSSRRSYVTTLVQHGVPITVVSKLAGHSSTNMTDRYVCGNTLKLPDTAMSFFNG